MDSFEINKIIGALLGAAVLIFVINMIGDGVFPGPQRHADAGQAAAPEAAAGAGPAAPAAPVVVAEPAAADGKAENGAKVFKKCAACHSVEAADGHKIGPNLHAVAGRAIGKAAGFSFSPAMAGHGGEWSDAALSAYLAAPKTYIPGNKMAFAGLPKPQDRADVIAYLRQQGAGAPPAKP